MPSHKTRSGKHPIIVRLTEQEYAAVKQAAFEFDVTPNVYMALASVTAAMDYLDGKKRKE